MSTSAMEPSDVGPAVGGNLGVSESDRQHVVTLLQAAAAQGRLTTAELEERVAAARAAATFDDLVPLTRDLVNLAPGGSWQATPSAPVAVLPEGPEIAFALFSGCDRKATVAVRRYYSALCMFGGVTLDLSGAPFEDTTCTVNVFALFGGVEVIVPRGVSVRNDTVAIFGGAGLQDIQPAVPGAPTVQVRGFVGFGGVSVRHPK